jgi:HAD superfamily hydrolase (TIGR01549 family)
MLNTIRIAIRVPVNGVRVSMPLVTIDFHNTLFQCDDWFKLEIETLPIAVLTRLRCSGLIDPGDRIEDEAVRIYRGIRVRAMETGVECDADTSIVKVTDSLGLHIDPVVLRQTVAEIMWEATATAAPLDGAQELVYTLAEERVPMIVVSSAAYHPFLEWCLRRFDMRASFQHVVTSAACGIYKSNPEIYRYAMDLVGVEPAHAIHVGDSHRFDVTSAGMTGMKTILLGDPDTPLNPPPDAIVRSLGEAKPHLDRLLPSVESELT